MALKDLLYVLNYYWLQELAELRPSKNFWSNESWDIEDLWQPLLYWYWSECRILITLHVWKRYVFVCVFIVCVILCIYLKIYWRNGCWNRENRNWMRRRIPEWTTVGRIIGGVLMRKAEIRRIFMPWGGRSTLNGRMIWYRESFWCPFQIQKGGTLFGLVWRIISPIKKQ